MNNYLQLIIWFIPMVFLHELGHYLAYRMYGVKAKIGFKMGLITVGEDGDLFKLTTKQFMVVLHSGIVLGYLYTAIFSNKYYMILYIMMCIFDIYNIIGYWKVRHNGKLHGENVRDMLKEKYLKYNEYLKKV